MLLGKYMERQSQKRIIRKAFLRLTFMNVLILIANCACGLIDNIFVGRILGKDALAAVGFFSPVTVAAGLSYVIILGTQVLTGNLVGAGQTKKVNQLFVSSFVVLTVIFTAFSLCCYCFHQGLARLLGADGESFSLLCEYAKAKGIALAGCYANVSAKIIQNLSHIHSMYGDHSAEPQKHITCMGLWGQATVRPNGDVSVCCFTYKPVLGSLQNNSFEEIWRSERAQELRELVKSGQYIDAPCVGCDTGHPVFTEDLALTGSLDSYFAMSINGR